MASNVQNKTGVESVAEAGDNAEITMSPDNIIAKEMQAIKISNSKASTSSSNIKASRVHIHNPKLNVSHQQPKYVKRLTWVCSVWCKKKQEKGEDEIDLAFVSMATRMRIHLN